MLRFSLCVVVCVGMVVGLVGCGSSNDLGTAAVNGTVTYNGSPVEGATVSFVPADEAGKMAAGITDAEGKFTLTTTESGDGAVPGAYQVAISKVEGEAAGPEQTEEEAYASAFPGPGGAKDVEVKDLLPARYKIAMSSNLTFTVKSGGDNNPTFELTDQ